MCSDRQARRLCKTAKTCTISNFGDVAYFYIPALGFAFRTANQHAKQPIPSTPNRFDLFAVDCKGC